MTLKRSLVMFAAFFLAAVSFAGEITFYGETDKHPLQYKPGEKMVFTIQCLEDGKPVDGQKLAWLRSGDDGKTENGQAISSASEPLVIETSIDVPGFVRIQVVLVDEKGAWLNGESRQFNGGAGVLLDDIAGYEEPADFDAYWDKKKNY
ncbi:MAG: acetylxylan esterase, partial [Thermoguttaceae bacterium]|nr:acetylxylan esterase [Thermoguttaceae bacterium]